MSHQTLPLILSLPHGGFDVPDEVADRIGITHVDIYNECDLWINELFDFSSHSAPQTPDVLARIDTPIARAIVDVNRPPNEFDNPDGPVKSQTSYGQTTCRIPLTHDEKKVLVERYWRPFHDTLTSTIDAFADQARLFLDCHNMAQVGPSAFADSGSPRPLICLANLGSTDGSTRRAATPNSCSAVYIRATAAIAEEVFADVSLLHPLPGPTPPTVAINQPYPGGYILRQYALARQQRPLPPGLMIELNRGLFVGNQNAGTAVEPPNEERIRILRDRLYHWLSRLVSLEL